MTSTVFDTELLARLEAATEGSLEFDTDLCCAFFGQSPERGKIWNQHFSPQYSGIVPAEFSHTWRSYSRNLGAAVFLVSNLSVSMDLRTMHHGVVGGHAWLRGPSGPLMSDIVPHGESLSTVNCRRSLALALCIAALKAKDYAVNHGGYSIATTVTMRHILGLNGAVKL